jgi:predicted dehydrogenase/threonine dehydrogenase-like Zn-dependent dehydrogenase
MKQVIQSLSDGSVKVEEIPAPTTLASNVLIASRISLVSPGTERMLLEFGRSGWLERVRQQPDKVRQVFEKIRTDGVLPTIEAVRSKLDQPLAMGYCNVGRIIELGPGSTGLGRGDRVLSNGPHAEIIRVARNLVVRIPEELPDEQAALGILGAVAMQGIRLASPTIGETFVVTGLGLIGLLTVQLLRANGCRVVGIDFDRRRLDLAARFGATVVDLTAGQDPERVAEAMTHGRGVDGVLVCAATNSSQPISQAARMCRKRGRVVLVGVTGLELSRADFYEKEISFQVSCSYGPGRYDPMYEQEGHDYPFGLVRWTAQRNIEAFLQLAAGGSLDLEPLITHRFDLGEAAKAYESLASDHTALGITLRYADMAPADALSRTIAITAQVHSSGRGSVSFFGSGNYAARVLIPAFSRAGAKLRMLCNTGSLAGAHVARHSGFESVTTDPSVVLQDSDTSSIVVATRHDTHAEFVISGLRAGKNVFVEKPLALTETELAAVEEAWNDLGDRRPVLTVGFNRRFAPLAVRLKSLATSVRGPKCIIYTVSAGDVPREHWTQQPRSGGGRIVGEACHFIDFIRWLVGAPITAWTAAAARDQGETRDDCASIVLTFADGSLGTVHYFANGGRRFPKERVELFAGGAALRLDNFRLLHGFGWPKFSRARTWRQDKGQVQLAQAFLEACGAKAPMPIPGNEIFEVARVSIECAEAVRRDLRVSVTRSAE